MDEMPDLELLRQFADSHSESAFATLVHRHLNLVYSAALRQMGNPHAAEEIAQVVFIILAQKAATIRDGTVLAGWLVRTTRFAAANALDKNRRRVQREQEAYMQSTLDESGDPALWENVAPLLDDALGRLAEADRAAIVLRYFQRKSLSEVGLALGTNEDTARKRVARSLEKLRKIFSKRGAVTGTAALAAVLTANSVHAAPASLAGTIIPVAVTKGTVAGVSTFSLLKGTLKLMAWTKTKTIIVVTVAAALAGGTATVAVKKFHTPTIDNSLWLENSSSVFEKMPKTIVVRPTQFHDKSMWITANDHFFGRDCTITSMMQFAYEFNPTRIEFKNPPDQRRFDLLANLDHNNRPEMRAVIKDKLGLVARTERQAKETLLLKVKNPGASGLRPAAQKNRNSSSGSLHGFTVTGGRISQLASMLEHHLQKPVNDQTGLAGQYDFDLEWPESKGAEKAQAIETALLEQLGLELVPETETMEVLVVEKAR